MFTNNIKEYADHVVDNLQKGNYNVPSLLYTNPQDLTNINQRNIKGGYRTVSLYSKSISDATIEMTRLTKEIDKNIRETNDRIRVYAKSVNGAKHEVALREIVSGLLNTKLNAIKAKVDFATKEDNSRKQDYKLALDSGANVSALTTGVSSTDHYMSNMLNGQYDTNHKYNFKATNIVSTPPITDTSRLERFYQEPEVTKPVTESTPIQTESTPITTSAPVQQPIQQPIEEHIEEKVVVPDTSINEVPEEEKIVLTPKVMDDDDEGLDDFISDPSLDRDYALAYNNIKAYNDPDVKLFFKYNKKEGIGYLVACNTKTMEELNGVTTIPLKLLYPWDIDYSNNIVSTYIREDYPILYTEDPIPDDIREEYNTLVSVNSKNTNEDDVEETQ